MSTTELILKELRKTNKRFFACDNVSEFVTPERLNDLEEELTLKFTDVLNSLLIDVNNDPNSKETPRRLAKMFLKELFSGRYEARPKVTSFPNVSDDRYTGMLVVRAEINSVCAHHYQPVYGTAYIGIIPSTEVIGLSKYVRLAQWCARRGTLQEELTNQIATEIMSASNCDNVGVHIRAEHGCCTNRGIQAHSSLTQTTVLRGLFDSPDVKAEFFDNIKMQIQND